MTDAKLDTLKSLVKRSGSASNTPNPS
jgi:hypothetical protein